MRTFGLLGPSGSILDVQCRFGKGEREESRGERREESAEERREERGGKRGEERRGEEREESGENGD